MRSAALIRPAHALHGPQAASQLGELIAAIDDEMQTDGALGELGAIKGKTSCVLEIAAGTSVGALIEARVIRASAHYWDTDIR